MMVTVIIIFIVLALLSLAWYNKDRCKRCFKKGMVWEKMWALPYEHWVCYKCGWRQNVDDVNEPPMTFKDGEFELKTRPEPPSPTSSRPM